MFYIFAEKKLIAFPEGMDRCDLKVDDYVTLSSNLQTGDRSVCSSVCKIEAINNAKTHADIMMVGGYNNGRTMLINLVEHKIYDADSLDIEEPDD